MIQITEQHLDDALGCVDTLEVCGALLASDEMTDELAASVSRLLGSVSERLTANIGLLEQVATEQNRAQADEARDDALIIAGDRATD